MLPEGVKDGLLTLSSNRQALAELDAAYVK